MSKINISRIIIFYFKVISWGVKKSTTRDYIRVKQKTQVSRPFDYGRLIKRRRPSLRDRGLIFNRGCLIKRQLQSHWLA